MQQSNDFTSSHPNHTEFPPPNPIQAPAFASAAADYPSAYTPYPQSDPNPNLPPSAPPSCVPQPHFPSYPPYTPSFPHLQQPYHPYDPTPLPTGYNPAQGAVYYNEAAGNYSANGDVGYGYDQAGFGEGAYRYDGGGMEPYGARGTGSTAKSSSLLFDDYGRSISLPAKEQGSGGEKIVRAVPKADVEQDARSAVQKFRVKLLPEGGGQSTTDVLCQIGLDGIRMLDPNTYRTLRIYPLETVTRGEVTDPSIYTFWSKSSVDIEPRRIRLQSNSYTTSTILDTVTAATVQLKEMGGRDSLSTSRGTVDGIKQYDQPTEKKKAFIDWMNKIKPGNEEKDHWVPDEAVTKCTSCRTDFGAFVRKHHCRNCGDIFCDKCTQGRIALTTDENAQPVRVCDSCMAEASHRLSNAKEVVNKSAGLNSYEDLAKKLQEVMEKTKTSSGPKSSSGPERQMREVACPICTVHLQVQVPTSGSETIECGVCQHPFLVSAH